MEVIIDGTKYVPVPDVPTDKGMLAALEVRFSSDAGDNLTVRDCLRRLLETLWDEQEGFSGKRPFGNSGWDDDLYGPLIKAGFITGEIDEDGCVQEISDDAPAYVSSLIVAAFHGISE